MLVHGSQRPRPNRGWTFLAKASQAAIFNTAVAVGGLTKVTVPTTGFKITLLARQALLIRRYHSTLVHAGALDDNLFAIGGEFNLQKAPFGLGNGVVTYPVMESIAVPQAAQAAAATPQGQQIWDSGLDFTLIDDWFEFDDTLGDGAFGTFQLQTLWTVWNQGAAGKTVTVTDRATWEIYEIPLVGIGNDP